MSEKWLIMGNQYDLIASYLISCVCNSSETLSDHMKDQRIWAKTEIIQKHSICTRRHSEASKIYSHGCLRLEKAQCVLWFARGHAFKAIQRSFRTKYRKAAPARSSIRRWNQEYQIKGNQFHMSGKGRPQINEENKHGITTIFYEETTPSLRNAAFR